MRNIFLFLLLSAITCFGQLRTVQYDPVTGFVVQTGLSIFNLKNGSKTMIKLNNTTNIVVDWRTNYYIVYPSNNFTISFANQPNEANTFKQVVVELVNTNSVFAYFPSNAKELDGSNPVLGGIPSTNMYFFNYSNQKFWCDSYQNNRTGLYNTNVYNRSPTLFDIRIPNSNAQSNYVWTCTNSTTGEGEWRNNSRSGIYRTLAIPAGAMLTNFTAGAIYGTEESIVNFKRRDFMEFTNTTIQTVCASVPMPETWDKGNVEVKVYWSASNAIPSKSVVWGISADMVKHDDPVDQSYGTEIKITSSQTAFNDLIKSSSSGNLNLGHSTSTSGAILDLRIRRLVDETADDLPGVAKIYFIVIRYFENLVDPEETATW